MTVYDVARALPGIEELRDHCQGLAMVEAVVCPEWGDRYYSFAKDVASMRNGEGDEYTIAFTPAGAYAEGFDHESVMSPWALDDPAVWPGVLDDVPEVFRPYVTDGAEGEPPDITVCLWRETTDTAWRTGTITFPTWGDGEPDGSDHLFELLLDRSAEAYAAWASDYYEQPVDVEAVRHVLALRPLTREVVAALNPEVDLADLARDVAVIGYPGTEGRQGLRELVAWLEAEYGPLTEAEHAAARAELDALAAEHERRRRLRNE